MRYQWQICLLLFVALLLTGCGARELVTERHRDTFSQPATGRVFTHTFPRLELSGAYADKVNAQICALCEEQQNEAGEMPIAVDYSYEFHIWEDILSLVIREAYPEQIQADDFARASRHMVYTLHISDGSEATAEELLATAGTSSEAFYPHAMELMGAAFCAELPEEMLQGHLAMEEVNPQNALFLRFQQTISEENVAAVQLYLDDAGALHFAASVFQIAGDDSFSALFSASDRADSAAYVSLVEKLSELNLQ